MWAMRMGFQRPQDFLKAGAIAGEPVQKLLGTGRWSVPAVFLFE